jgi:hypothetical protein
MCWSIAAITHIEISADRWPNHIRLSDIESRLRLHRLRLGQQWARLAAMSASLR